MPANWLKKGAVTAVAAFVLGAGITWGVMHAKINEAQLKEQHLQQEVVRQEQELLGWSRYTSYLTVSKQSLMEQVKLLTATVVRNEGVTQVIERSLLGFKSTGTVAIWYTADYAVGFDLQPNQYDIVSTGSEIEVHVKKPQLVAQPAVHDLRYQVLSGGVLTDEKTAVIELYAQAAREAQTRGEAMASDPAVMALSEKKLLDFLRDFLLKQPDVKVVPHIKIIYTN